MDPKSSKDTIYPKDPGDHKVPKDFKYVLKDSKDPKYIMIQRN